MAELINTASLKQMSKDPVIYLVEEQSNPSTDYFILPAISSLGLRAVHCGFEDMPSPADLEGACVIFVRYLPKAWSKLIEGVRANLHSLIFFIDDDVLDTGATAGLPLRYRYKLARLGSRQAAWLKNQKADLWVSNEYLLKKYASWNPKLVLPSPLPLVREYCRVFYHGSASHDAEIRWLRPVMDEVLSRDEHISFEIIGGRDVHRMYRGIPRVTVVHPMKWTSYGAFQSLRGRHIGLAPLLDTIFNKARSYTKYFDITRSGAVGIYSPNSAYAEVVTHGHNGLIVVLEQKAWAEAILNLAKDENWHRTMLLNAENKCAELEHIAQQSYAPLLKLE